MTQEELADALFVSRTAISKWESGRGYPSLDSLKQISRYFSVSIDELICPEEIISAAEEEKKASVDRIFTLTCGTLDILLALLLFLPVFGNGTDKPTSVSLFTLTGISPWIKTVFATVITLSVLNGICCVIISHLDHPIWDRHRLVTSMVLSIVSSAIFVLTRQPYAGITSLAVLVVKGWLIGKERLL